MQSSSSASDRLAQFMEQHQPLFVLTGAGCSTASGIPDYRDEKGEWKQAQPMDYRDFIGHESNRKRYWARSMLGWPKIAGAEPAAVHHGLLQLERAGLTRHLVTQNVDGLHQRAGSRQVLELHGNLQWVICLGCGERIARSEVQDYLLQHNADFSPGDGKIAPDGDIHLRGVDYESFRIMPCPGCGGILKPDVVFYGESVPREKVESAYKYLEQSAAVLILGSSVMVYSAYRFCRRAVATGLPIAAINRGITRADGELALKLEEDCGETIMALLSHLGLAV